MLYEYRLINMKRLCFFFFFLQMKLLGYYNFWNGKTIWTYGANNCRIHVTTIPIITMLKSQK